MSIDKSLIDCVVAIGTNTPEGKREWIGSGFFYAYPHLFIEDGTTGFIVTNRHVVEDLNEIVIRFNQDNLSESEITVDDDVTIFFHPDEDIDVAIINISYLAGKKIPYNLFLINDEDDLNIENIINSNIREGKSIYVVGFPVGIVNDHQNAALVRNGSIAQIQNLINGIKNEFIIDASIFPGNSGGPVFSRPDSIKGENSYTTPKLIGIVQGYYTYSDKAISPQTLQTRVLFEENSGLGAVYPIDIIEETIKEHYKYLTKTARNLMNNANKLDKITDLDIYTNDQIEELENKIVEDIKDYIPNPVIEKIISSIEDEDTKKHMWDQVLNDLIKEVNLIKGWCSEEHAISSLISKNDLDKVKQIITETELLIDKYTK